LANIPRPSELKEDLDLINSTSIRLEKEAERGDHFDDDKPRVDLVPTELVRGAGRAFGYGAEKYGEDNFRGGIKTRRLVGSILRHILAWLDGEDLDGESSLAHFDHAAANLGMLMWMLENRPDLDDRWRGNNKGSL
jgi:hypothetical protein